jgi:hypothetical protein
MNIAPPHAEGSPRKLGQAAVVDLSGISVEYRHRMGAARLPERVAESFGQAA